MGLTKIYNKAKGIIKSDPYFGPDPLVPSDPVSRILNKTHKLLKSHKRKHGGDDDDPPAPTNQSRLEGFSMANAKRHTDSILRCPPRKGVGYRAPGPIFLKGNRPLDQQFAIELTSGINHRNFTRTAFRTYHRITQRPLSTQPSVLFSKTLSPQVLERLIDGNYINSAVRNANMYSVPTTTVASSAVTPNREDIMFPLLTLQDLEIASWNARSLKFLDFNMANATIQGTNATWAGVNTAGFLSSCVQPLQVLTDWYLDKTAVETAAGTAGTVLTYPSSPFDTVPITSGSYGGLTVRPMNFLCDLGPGSVKFQFQNRLNTSAEIEIVVCRLRYEPGVNNSPNQVSNNYPLEYESQLGEAYLAKHTQGSFVNQGYGGEGYSASDILINPTKPFLKAPKKYMTRSSLMVEVSRDRFRVQGGATRASTVLLPAVTYDAYEHRRWHQRPLDNTAGDLADVFQYPNFWIQPHSYVIYISTQGVLMPCFTATNTAGVISAVGTTVVDTQVCPSSVLIHGNYRENPRPCLSVSPVRDIQCRPELIDAKPVTSVGKSPNAVLLSGYVADPPIATSTAAIVT